MSEYNEIQIQLAEVESILQERDQATAYIRITDEMGPCSQLLAFINKDGTLITDDGVALESMNMFDQHNFVLSKLNVDTLDQLATEGLKETIIKYRKWLIVGGIFVPFVGWPLLIAGIAGVAMNRKTKGEVPSVKSFTALTKIFNGALKQDTLFTAVIPNSANAKDWEKVDTSAFQESLTEAMNDRADLKEDAVDIDKSGWTAETYVNAVKWLKENREKVEAADKARAGKLENIENALSGDDTKVADIARHVSGVVSQATKMSRFTVSVFEDIAHMMTKVSHHFTPTSKSED